jgi:hypothetical protein
MHMRSLLPHLKPHYRSSFNILTTKLVLHSLHLHCVCRMLHRCQTNSPCLCICCISGTVIALPITKLRSQATIQILQTGLAGWSP